MGDFLIQFLIRGHRGLGEEHLFAYNAMQKDPCTNSQIVLVQPVENAELGRVHHMEKFLNPFLSTIYRVIFNCKVPDTVGMLS